MLFYLFQLLCIPDHLRSANVSLISNELVFQTVLRGFSSESGIVKSPLVMLCFLPLWLPCCLEGLALPWAAGLLGPGLPPPELLSPPPLPSLLLLLSLLEEGAILSEGGGDGGRWDRGKVGR